MTDNPNEKVFQQFDSAPYPKVPIEASPIEDINSLYVHNLVTSRYLRDQCVVESKDRNILELGCGSGYGALILAHANPGAHIVAVDWSSNSTRIAQQRLEHHGFRNCEFHTMALQDLSTLGMQFDYINCDEVLYLIPDPVDGLKAMKSVLKPEGIIRTNLHSLYQRQNLYRAQEFFRILGLFDGNPSSQETGAVRETMEALYDGTYLKKPWNRDRALEDQWILMNYLIQEDRGSTIPDVFRYLRAANLEWISMVQWQTWDLKSLFESFPEFLAAKIKQLSYVDRLHLFDLIHPIHRLLDFWCGHPREETFTPPEHWNAEDWQNVTVHLHPQLKMEERKDELLHCVRAQQSLWINRWLTEFDPFWIESSTAACLLPLWDKPQRFSFLVNRWLQLHPVHPISLEPAKPSEAFDAIKKILIDLEYYTFVLFSH